MNEVDFVVYRRGDIPKIPKDAKVVHIAYKMSIEDVGDIIRTRESLRAIQFPPSIVNQLHPFVERLLAMQGIKRLVGYADRYDSKFIKEARKLREKGWGYQKIANHISERIKGDLSAQTVWYWVNKRNKYVRI